jgi:hypothetical protein
LVTKATIETATDARGSNAFWLAGKSADDKTTRKAAIPRATR